MEYLPEPHSYINESERNVHVWCSLVKPCSDPQFLRQPTLGLIAGCYAHAGGLPVSVFYKWLHMIIQLEEEDTFKYMFLFPCQDPRLGGTLSNGGIPLPNTQPLERKPPNTIMIETGHYMLYRYDPRKKKYEAIWPTLAANKYSRRSHTASQTCSPSPGTGLRDTKTRLAVLMRDQRCVVTGQEAVERARGGNFTGLEVAHVFPLMGVGNVGATLSIEAYWDLLKRLPLQIDWTHDMAAEAQAEVRTRELADTPRNAILLRVDIHTLFDDYQWSLWPVGGKSFRVVRFEKSGAKVLDQHEGNINLGSLSGLKIASPPSEALILEHLRVALLEHVRGFGRRPKCGYRATLLPSA